MLTSQQKNIIRLIVGGKNLLRNLFSGISLFTTFFQAVTTQCSSIVHSACALLVEGLKNLAVGSFLQHLLRAIAILTEMW